MLWPAITFVLSMMASGVGGRALWIDEIMRFLCQERYTVEQLLACKHLSDFDSQSPIGYVLWRPVQSLLGIELGGALLSALAAAVFVWAALSVARRIGGGRELSRLSCAVVAISPLVVYYGGELWFYMPWAAAFTVAVDGLLAWDGGEGQSAPRLVWRVLAIAAATLSVSLHFAGIFTWFVAAAAFCIVRCCSRGIAAAARSAIAVALPAMINMPLYLKAQFAAGHLDSAGAKLDRLSSLPGFIGDYFLQIFPALGGGWWFGVALAAVGVAVLVRRRRTSTACLLVAIALSGLVYSSYVYLRGYTFVVARFWLCSMAGVIPLIVVGCEALSRRWRFGVLAPVAMLACNLVGTVAVVQMEGRTLPSLRFARELGKQTVAPAVVCPNHYDIRPFSNYAHIGGGCALLFPSYWEQGEAVRRRGLADIRRIAPLAPVFAPSGTFASLEWTPGRMLSERRTPIQLLAIRAHLFPEPNSFPEKGAYQVLIPEESSLVAAAEESGRPVFAPGAGWTIGQMPPQANDRPCTTFLVLQPKARGVLRVYVPKGFDKDTLVLDAAAGSNQSGTATFGTRSFGLDKTFRPVKMPLRNLRKGVWNELYVNADSVMVALAAPSFR